MDEYIIKLQIHQHSLLTRKVFLRHNFQHWYSSLYQLDHLRLQIIFIFKSYSISNLDHLLIWIIIGHHHWISIITQSQSSLDLDHHSIWIITSYHHWISIITRSRSPLVLSHDSSHHRNLYRAIPFSCWLGLPSCRSSPSTYI